jgi:MFS superfamily sulfate permease-like transporter
MLVRVFPFLNWYKGYDTSKFRADFVAGLTVALVLIPQSMAYAQLAGLPAHYGLYASFLPPMVAALFGSSRQLATGPVAIVSLMTAATLEPLATAGSEAFIAYAIFLALLIGLFQLSLGVLRLGVVVNFLSHPVVIGFTNAAAIIIATSQLSKMFGVTVDKAEHNYETVWRVIVAAHHFTHWPTFLLGALAFGIMIVLKKLNPKIPYVLAAVVVTTLISRVIGLEDNRLAGIDQVESQTVREQIQVYNRDVRDIALVSEARAILERQVEKLAEVKDEDLCMTCHKEQQVDLDMLRDESMATVSLDVDPKTALELHAMAGLLDKQISQVKELASEIRTELRGLKFVLIEENRTPHFALAAGTTGGRGIWRLQVGNKPLDPEKLVFIGGGAIVGAVPSGLPRLSVPQWDSAVFGKLFIAAIIISILGFMEAISIAKAIAARTGQRLDPNQELIGQGIANIVGSFGQSYAISGSFSRSAVNIQAGAVTGLSSVFTSAIVVVVLLFFTPLLYYLPQSVLAAVIMMAVIGLINFKGVVHAYKVKHSDGVISVISFVATLAFAPHLDKGILLGVLLTLGVFLYGRMKPATAELSLGRDGHFHNADRLRLTQCRYLAVIRFDGPLFFANASYLEDEVLDRLQSLPELKAILIKSDGISEIDASGEETLSLLVDRLRSGGVDVYFSGLNERVIDTLRRSHLSEKIGKDHIFMTVTQAVESIWARTHEDSEEAACPLIHVIPIGEVASEAKIRVLMVDDEQDLADLFALRLNKRGMNVDVAYAGDLALERVQKVKYDAVILDMKLGRDNGQDILLKIRDLRPDLAVIMLTGFGSIESAVEAVKHGAYDFMLKPCDIDDLVDKIREAYRQNV